MAGEVETKFVADVSKMEKSIEKTTAGITTMRKSVVLLINNLRKTTQVIRQLTDYTDDYVSSMRLMNIVFKDGAKQANAFAEKLSRITGLDEPTLIRQVSMFRQLGESINLTDEYSDKLAEGLTTLSAKMSILYNKDFNVMATALQRAIQGTQETMKALTGIEATELGQQMVLTSHGIDRQVSSLNEAERSIVMYASILQKVTNDQKVYEEAVNSVAWQKQMLTAQVKRLGSAIGGVLYPVLQKVLPVLNAILMVITEIITIFAKLVGFSVDASASVGNTASSYGDLAKNITAAGNAAKKQLRGFDKLNNISTPSSGGSAGGGALSVDPQVLGLLDQMENNMLNIKNRATEIADKIMTWLGFSRDANGEWQKATDQLTRFDIIVKGILTTLLLIAGFGIAKKVVSIYMWVKQMKEFIGLMGIPLSVVAQIFGGVMVAVFGIYSIVKGIIELLKGDTFNGIMDIIAGIALVVAGVAIAFGGWTVAAVAALVAIAAYVTKWVVNNWTTVKNFFIKIWDFFVEKFGGTAQWLYDNVIKPIIDFFAPIVDAIVSVYKRAQQVGMEILTGIWEAIKSIFSKIVEIVVKVIEIFVALGKAFYTYVIKPIWESYLKPALNWIYNNLIKPLWDKFVWLKDKIVGIFKTVATAVVDFVGGTVKSVINGILGVIESKINKFIRLINKSVDVINQIPGVSITKITELKIPRLKNGGFPQGEDGLFYANHNELVGEFSNGRTAVANNGQIVEGIKSGVYSAMMSALSNSNFGADVTIEATGDASGLLDFITFNQKQRDRQYN